VPSTRDLARQLGISRRVVVDAYEQLAAEGYLLLRQGARPRVAEDIAITDERAARVAEAVLPPRYDFRPSVPDVAAFPRSAWLRSFREGLAATADHDLVYGDPRGVPVLRAALADYLGRVRGVVAGPERVIVTNGYQQALGLVCHALAARGAKRLAIEDPSFPEQRDIAARAGLEAVPARVDEGGIRIDALERTDADAVALTPAHQHPTGVVLAGERRAALLAWLRARGAFAIEDDYDAEFRYDRAAVGALQGLAPERVVYAGSTSKTLAPALRLGWMVVPDELLEEVSHQKFVADMGTARIEQFAFADFLARGELDRHLRRMRVQYRGRRDAIVAALAEALPEARVRGIAAGLHATVALPEGYDEEAILAEARRRRIELAIMAEHRIEARDGPPTLLLGFARLAEPSILSGVREVAEAVRATR
jgi:GntR family transcriptional regulator / MocR family aminotransferase